MKSTSSIILVDVLIIEKYDRIVILGDFNSEPINEPVETFCSSYNLHNLIKEKTCFKGPPKCYDLILTNYKHNFQNTLVVTTGFSDFHKMTVTVLKTEFVKSDPIQINYRDYKKYNAVNFSEDLWNRLNSDISFSKDYSKFQNVLGEVLNKHAPLKKKYLRANNSPFMTKQLRKMIMNRSRCKNAYFKNKTSCKLGKILSVRVTQKVKREYFENLNINFVNENKTFWKTVKPYFSNKNMKNSKIVLVENNEIITDNTKNAEIMNNYFVNITQNLNIPESILEKIPRNTDVECLDPIDQILLNYSKHPIILKIKVFVKPIDTFSFNKVDEKEIEKEILELSSNKSAGPDAIPPRVIKDSVSVLKSPLTQLFNTSFSLRSQI